MKILRLIALPSAAIGLAAPALAIDSAPMPNVQVDERVSLSGISISAGLAYWEGDFGGPTTSELLVVPVSLRYDSGTLRAWATLPYMRVESEGVLFAGTDGGPIFVDPATASPAGTVREGLGDLTVGATWSVWEEGVRPVSLDLTSRIKLPTADDDDGLSTGKTDISFAVDVSRAVNGVVPYVSAGYKFIGDPDGFDLDNTVSLAAGLSVPLGEVGDTIALIAYEYDSSASDLVDDGHEIFSAISGSIDDRFTWTAYGSVGLSDGASDFALGALFTVKL